MAGVFRFSNAVSDIDKFIDTYKRIYEYFIDLNNNGKYFDHDDAAKFLALNGLASSLGAIGSEALKRSVRKDKSRDPLYNQHKSYSEIFRMLGWYEPGSQNTNFKLTEFGYYISACDDPNVTKKLFGTNLLHIVSPNPRTTVKGYNILRPFAYTLKLMDSVGGKITRDEIILYILACEDDTENNAISNATEGIKRLRSKGYDSLEDALLDLRKEHNLGSSATLGNYTRFPISALKWMGWVTGKMERSIYPDKSIKVLTLTEEGAAMARRTYSMPDIRYKDLEEGYSKEEIAAFVNLSNLLKLDEVGFSIDDYSDMLPKLRGKCKTIFRDFGIKNDQFLFFGYQEAPKAMLSYADELLESL